MTRRLKFIVERHEAAREPVVAESPKQDDPFYRLANVADAKGSGFSNEDIDGLVYCLQGPR